MSSLHTEHTYHGYVATFNNKKLNTMKREIILSFSVTPIITCPVDVPCIHRCYAVRIARMRKKVRESWNRNKFLLDAGVPFVEDICDLIAYKHVKYFRWHVGGDIYSDEYMEQIIQIANICPDTKFSLPTKNYAMIEKYHDMIPANLHVLLSVWRDYHPSAELMNEYPIGIYRENELTKIDGYKCPEKCDKCLYCYNAVKGQKVIFDDH